MNKKWELAYHEVGQYFASKGCPNDLFSKYESLAFEIRKTKDEAEKGEKWKSDTVYHITLLEEREKDLANRLLKTCMALNKRKEELEKALKDIDELRES